jgi:hypothetical protein
MIVSDNGTELTGNAMLKWTSENGIAWHYITSLTQARRIIEAYRLIDDQSDRARVHHGEAGGDAYFFLREPLYRFGGNAYKVADWVLWPLCSGPGAVDSTEARYRLWQGAWSPGWTGEKLFIFDRREELS